MGKGLLGIVAAAGIAATYYAAIALKSDRPASEKLASLVRIASESSRAPLRRIEPAQAIDRGALPFKVPDAGVGAVPAVRAAVLPPVVASHRIASTAMELPLTVELSQSASGAVPGSVAQIPATMSPVTPLRRHILAKPGDDRTHRGLSRLIQDELRRVGCYNGDSDGAWSLQTQRAMKSFIDRVNASLPISEPDYILLTLLQGYARIACGKDCPSGQVLSQDGRCQVRAVIRQADSLQRMSVEQRPSAGSAPANVAVQMATSLEEAAAQAARRQQRLALEQRQDRLEAERQAKTREARQKQAALEQQQAEEREELERQRNSKLEAARATKARATRELRERASSTVANAAVAPTPPRVSGNHSEPTTAASRGLALAVKEAAGGNTFSASATSDAGVEPSQSSAVAFVALSTIPGAMIEFARKPAIAVADPKPRLMPQAVTSISSAGNENDKAEQQRQTKADAVRDRQQTRAQLDWELSKSPSPRFGQRFMPPPAYVGGVASSPRAASRQVVQPPLRTQLFGDLARSAP